VLKEPWFWDIRITIRSLPPLLAWLCQRRANSFQRELCQLALNDEIQSP
jgi:hypothetical protein